MLLATPPNRSSSEGCADACSGICAGVCVDTDRDPVPVPLSLLDGLAATALLGGAVLVEETQVEACLGEVVRAEGCCAGVTRGDASFGFAPSAATAAHSLPVLVMEAALADVALGTAALVDAVAGAAAGSASALSVGTRAMRVDSSGGEVASRATSSHVSVSLATMLR